MAPIHVADPQAFVIGLLAPYSADNFNAALHAVKEQLHEQGFGVAFDDRGTARGRIFLPWSGCRDCSPNADRGTPTYDAAVKFGVSRNPAAWTREEQVIADRGAGPNTGFRWAWVGKDGRSPVIDSPPYVPLWGAVEQPAPPVDPPPVGPLPSGDVEARLERIEQILTTLADRPFPVYKGKAKYRNYAADVALSPEG